VARDQTPGSAARSGLSARSDAPAVAGASAAAGSTARVGRAEAVAGGISSLPAGGVHRRGSARATPCLETAIAERANRLRPAPGRAGPSLILARNRFFDRGLRAIPLNREIVNFLADARFPRVARERDERREIVCVVFHGSNRY